jgi:hypothetical protein
VYVLQDAGCAGVYVAARALAKEGLCREIRARIHRGIGSTGSS